MSKFCDNRTECRRVQICRYFGEVFDRNECIASIDSICDNCKNSKNAHSNYKDLKIDKSDLIRIEPKNYFSSSFRTVNSIGEEINLSNDENSIYQKCNHDLYSIINQTCLEKGITNINSIFPSKMIFEMAINMPRTKQDMTNITGYTDFLLEKFKGLEMLKILQHHGQILEERRKIFDNANDSNDSDDSDLIAAVNEIEATYNQKTHFQNQAKNLISDSELIDAVNAIEANYNKKTNLQNQAKDLISDSESELIDAVNAIELVYNNKLIGIC